MIIINTMIAITIIIMKCLQVPDYVKIIIFNFMFVNVDDYRIIATIIAIIIINMLLIMIISLLLYHHINGVIKERF
jgi:hypothetical protein